MSSTPNPIQDKIAVVTGAGSGIGAALARELAAQGAAGILVADLREDAAQAVAASIRPRALAVRCDVGREDGLRELADLARTRYGRIDLFFSNAGILGRNGGLDIDDAIWDSLWRIHVMAHVWAARAVLPGMVEQGGGAFVITASAAGLLNIVENPPYAVTKHAAVGFGEWLRIAYGRRGIRVHCLCPQAVDTPLIAEGAGSAALNGTLSPEDVARALTATLATGEFLCLPHPQVIDYLRNKAQDYDRWLGGMQKLYAQHVTAGQ